MTSDSDIARAARDARFARVKVDTEFDGWSDPNDAHDDGFAAGAAWSLTNRPPVTDAAHEAAPVPEPSGHDGLRRARADLLARLRDIRDNYALDVQDVAVLDLAVERIASLALEVADRPTAVRADDWHTGWVIPIEDFDRWHETHRHGQAVVGGSVAEQVNEAVRRAVAQSPSLFPDWWGGNEVDRAAAAVLGEMTAGGLTVTTASGAGAGLAQVKEAAGRLHPLLTEDGDWLVDVESAQFHDDVRTLVLHVAPNLHE